MNVQRTNITLPQSVLKQLQISVPQGKRSKFVAEAITEKLGKKRDINKELRKSLKANSAFYKKEAREIQKDFKHADAETLKHLP